MCGIDRVGVADHQVGRHVDIIIVGEPVLGGQLVVRKSHQLIECTVEVRPLAREDVDTIGALDLHRSSGNTITRHYGPTRRNGVTAHRISTNYDIYSRS